MLQKFGSRNTDHNKSCWCFSLRLNMKHYHCTILQVDKQRTLYAVCSCYINAVTDSSIDCFKM